MIYDSLDGTSGRTVWQLSRVGFPDAFVIAKSQANALAWLEAYDSIDVPVTVTDRGSADRTEIALWHDETRL